MLSSFVYCHNFDYCKLCKNNKKHIMCDHSGTFSRSCYPDIQILYLNEVDIELILDEHNKYRNLVASGKVDGLRAAARMPTMVKLINLNFFSLIKFICFTALGRHIGSFRKRFSQKVH